MRQEIEKKNPRGNMSVCPMQTKNDNTVSSLQELWQSRQKKNHFLEQLTLEERAIGNQNE